MTDDHERQPDQPRERVVDRTAHAEREWVEGESRRREERWEKRKRGIDAERREHRAAMTALELLRHALERIAKISTVPAGNVEPGRGGSEQIGPPRQQTPEDDPRWREHWEVIQSRLRRVHELLDEAEGLGPVAVKTLLASEKDKLIEEEGRGLSPLAVVEKLGRDITGSPETVRRVRKARGLSMKDGLPLQDQPAPAGPVRRVVIDQ